MSQKEFTLCLIDKIKSANNRNARVFFEDLKSKTDDFSPCFHIISLFKDFINNFSVFPAIKNTLCNSIQSTISELMIEEIKECISFDLKIDGKKDSVGSNSTVESDIEADLILINETTLVNDYSNSTLDKNQIEFICKIKKRKPNIIKSLNLLKSWKNESSEEFDFTDQQIEKELSRRNIPDNFDEEIERMLSFIDL